MSEAPIWINGPDPKGPCYLNAHEHVRQIDKITAERDAALAQVGAMKRARDELEWKPIETAPKDGTQFLGYWPNKPKYECWPFSAITWWVNYPQNMGEWACLTRQMEKVWRWENEGLPTHWLPLPTAPATHAQPSPDQPEAAARRPEATE